MKNSKKGKSLPKKAKVKKVNSKEAEDRETLSKKLHTLGAEKLKAMYAELSTKKIAIQLLALKESPIGTPEEAYHHRLAGTVCRVFKELGITTRKFGLAAVKKEKKANHKPAKKAEVKK